MTKFYIALSDEELREEIKRLEGLQSPHNDDYDHQVESQAFLEKCRKELELREKLDQ